MRRREGSVVVYIMVIVPAAELSTAAVPYAENILRETAKYNCRRVYTLGMFNTFDVAYLIRYSLGRLTLTIASVVAGKQTACSFDGNSIEDWL